MSRAADAVERSQSRVQRISSVSTATPGDPGKWFAAAKDAGLYDDALALASRSPCDPRTLTRAAKDLVEERPAFAKDAGLLALYWLAFGYSYEITGLDVWAAFDATMKAAERTGTMAETRKQIRALVVGVVHGLASAAGILERALEMGGGSDRDRRSQEGG